MAENRFLQDPLDMLLEESRNYEPPKIDLPEFARRRPAAAETAADDTSPARVMGTQGLMPPVDLQPLFEEASAEFGVPMNVLAALGQQESTYNPTAIGTTTKWGRAKGLMQYLDSTASGLGINPFDPKQAIRAAAQQMRARLDKGYSLQEAIAAHHGGDDREQWGPKTRQYVEAVTGKAGAIGEGYMKGAQQAEPEYDLKAIQAELDAQEPGRYKVLTPEEAGRYQKQAGLMQGEGAGLGDAIGDLLKPDAPSPLTAENQRRYEETARMPSPLSLENQMRANAGLGMKDTRPYQGFVEATAAQLGNVPERFQQSLAGLMQMAGESLGADREQYIAQRAAMLGMTSGDYKLLAWAGEHGLVDKEAQPAEALQYVKQNVAQSLTPEQEQQLDAAGIINPQEISAYARQWRKDTQQTMNEVRPEPESAAYYGSAAIGSLAEMAPMIGAAILTRSPTLATAIMGGQVGGQAYAEAREKGLDVDQAQTYALLTAGAEAAPEALVVGRLMRGGTGAIRRVLEGTVMEGAQEGVTAALQAGIDQQMIDPNMTLSQALVQIRDSMIIGAMAGGVMGGVVGAVDSGRSAPQPSARPSQAPVQAEPVARQQPAAQPEPPAEPAVPVTEPAPTTGQEAPAAAVGAEPPAQPMPAGPLSRAASTAIQPSGEPVLVQSPDGEVPGTLQSYVDHGNGQWTARVQAQDGNTYDFTHEDGVNIVRAPAPAQAEPVADLQPTGQQPEVSGQAEAPAEQQEQQFPASPMLADAAPLTQEAAAEQEPSPEAALSVEPQRQELLSDRIKRQAAAGIDQMTEQELRAELKRVARQIKDFQIAKDSPREVRTELSLLTNRRREVERSVNALAASKQARPVKAVKEIAKQQASADVPTVGQEVVLGKGRQSGTVVDVTTDAVKVKQGNRTEKMSRETFDKRLAAAGEQPTQQQTPAPIEGRDIDGDWTEFSQAAGTIGVPRAEMPQIKAEHRGAMVNFLNARGIQHQEETVPAASLKPTQAEFSREKVDKAKGFEGGDRSILVSSDNHVLDGHHQWLAKREVGDDVKVIRLDAPIRELLPVVTEFPSATQDDGAAPTTEQPDAEDGLAVPAPAPASKPEQPAESAPTAAYGASNKLVTADRAAEIRAKLKAKLNGSQLNSGVDPEILALGTELAIFHLEASARRFSEFARLMAQDLGQPLDKIRPYLRMWYNGARDGMEDAGLSIDGMDGPDEVRAALRQLDAPPADKPAQEAAEEPTTAQAAKRETVSTPAGREFEVEHKVVEADSLVTSNDESGAVNPSYPQELQPRDRSRSASQDQINDIASRLNPRLLGESPSATDGAPIISADGVVESGNGRTLAIRQAYARNTEGAQRYREWLAAQGYDVAGMRAPVLVRERVTPMTLDERIAYTAEANDRTTLEMSSTERALADARKLGPLLHLYTGGDLAAAANRDFVRAFVGEVAAKSDRGRILDADGMLSQDGRRRIEAALLASAYGDEVLITDLFESADSDIKAIGGALLDVAGNWARMRQSASEGLISPGVDVTPNLLEAVNLIRQARAEGRPIIELVRQNDMFSGELDSVTTSFMGVFYRGESLSRARGRDKVADALRYYAEQALLTQPGPNMFGDPAVSGGEILRGTNERVQRQEQQASQQQDFFAGPRPDGANPGAPGQDRQGPQPDASGQSPAQGDLNVPSASERVERDRANTGAPEPFVPEADGDAGAGDAAGAGRAGESPDGEPGAGRGDQRVPGARPAAGGARGDQRVHRADGQFEPESGTAGGAERAGGSSDSIQGQIVEQEREEAIADDAHAPGAGDLDQRLAAQHKAQNAPTKWGDKASIDAALPLLLPEQRDDVLKAEQRLAKNNGILYTNGTGTGKTASGLGVAKRFINAGKDNIVIVVPSDKIASDWVRFASMLGIELKQLADTNDNGKTGPVVTTYANFAHNESLAQREWDLVIADESHYLSSNESGDDTAALRQLRALTGHHDGFYHWVRQRHAKEWQAYSAAMQARSDANGNLDIPQEEYARREAAEAKAREKWNAIEQPAREVWDERWTNQDNLPKTVFLSATPFAYAKNTDYAEGYLFHYVEPADLKRSEGRSGGYNSGSPRDRFMMQHFGYRMRYNKLTAPEAGVNSQLMEQQFNQWLKNTGALSGRRLEVAYDYDRKFVLVDDAVGTKIDEGLKFLREADDGRYRDVYDAVMSQFDYQRRMYLLESMKARAAVPLIREHMALGRKVVVFHDYNQGGGFDPFKEAVKAIGDKDVKSLAREVLSRPMFKIDFTGLNSPIVSLGAAFPNALFFNGTVSKRLRRENADLFNDDESGRDLIVVQSDAGREGVSLHDTTGRFQRVEINLGMPVRPVAATQIEGRIYRTGQASDAVFRYLTTGTAWEASAFASKIAERASTAENLALGEEARGLKDAFIEAYQNADVFPASREDGKGGKDYDRKLSAANATSPFDRAKTFYWAQQKNTKRRDQREGADYYATPEPVGFKMVEWANIQPNEKALEPSAGHGAIARFFPDLSDVTMVEPSYELSQRAALANGNARIVNDRFEALHINNKYDAIVMNPPYGSGGKTAIEHLAKAAKHLRDGGRVVALIPRGGMADKRLDAFLESEEAAELYTVANISLPAVTFERAGTGVNTRILVLEKHANAADAEGILQTNPDLSNAETINELFDRLENLELPSRKPTSTPAPKQEIVEHVTQKGKTLRGIIRTDLDKAQAQEIDKFTFRKKNAAGETGWFIRLKNLDDDATRYSVQDDEVNAAEPMSVEAVRDAITRGGADQVTDKMLEEGLIVIHRSAETLPAALGRGKRGMQAVTAPNGKIHLVASSLTPRTANAVLLHELFHSGTENLLGSKRWGELLGRLASLYRQSEQSRGRAREVFDRARERVAAAQEQGAVASRMEVEEFGAYAIEEYERAPDSLPAAIRKWVDDIVGAVKAWLFRRYGRQLGQVTPAQLRALAKEALASQVAQRQSAQAVRGVDSGDSYSLSAMKSVEANIRRGRNALARAVADKTNAHRAMFRNGLGWVDFVWGSTGRVKPSGKTVGAMGLSHIIEARQRKDGKSAEDALRLLDGVVETIARGEEFSRMVVGKATRVGVEHGDMIVWMTKREGSNAWVVTGYEKRPDVPAAGRATDRPTHAAASRTRDDVGAGNSNNGIDNGQVNLSSGPDDTRYSVRPSKAFNDLNQAQKDFLDKIGPERLPQRLADRLHQLTDNLALRIRQTGVDRYAALLRNDRELLGDDTLEGSIASSSWVLARMSSAAGGAVSALMNNGRIYLDPKEKVVDVRDGTKGLAETLRELGSPVEIDRFMGWIAANRANRLMVEGRENLFTSDEIAAGMKLSGGKLANGKSRSILYAKAWREFQQHRDDVLGIAEATGIITREQRETWREEFYVPFYRVIDEDMIGGPSSSSGLSRQQAYKKLKGGKQKLNDLLGNTLLNFHHLLQASLKNQAAAQALQNAEALGIAERTTESGRDKKASTFVLEDGEKQWYNIDDPLTFKAVSAISNAGLNTPLMKAGRAFKRFFTNMTTITPQFVVANALRDSLSAMATSPTSAVPFKTALKGALTYGNDRNRARMMASGGAFSFGQVYGQSPDEIKASLTGALRKAQVLRDPSLIPGVLLGAWRKYHAVTDFAENINRAGIWERNLSQGKLKAAFEARDLMDFSAHGDAMIVRIMIDLVPFLNARIQGLDKLYRSGVKPSLKTIIGKGANSDRQAFARFGAVVGALTTMSVLLFLRNWDDEEYRKLEDWQRDTYWVLRFGDDMFFIPKPFEVGAIATMGERLAEQFVDPAVGGEKFAQRLGHMLTDTFAFNPLPQLVKPLYELGANEDTFTGRPIEDQTMQRLSPSLRSRPDTSRLADSASRGMESALGLAGTQDLALSPVQIDHLIKGYAGAVGATAVGLADTIWRRVTGEELPARLWHEYQPIRRFYRDLTKEPDYTRYGTDFYEALKKADRAYADLRHLERYGETKRAGELAEKKADELGMRKALEAVRRDLSRINAEMKQVQTDKTMSPGSKRLELDRLRSIRNLITEEVGKELEREKIRMRAAAE